MEKKCPGCYFSLPDPETALAPYDSELTYFMWGPGFQWQPEPVEESMSSIEESYEESEQSEGYGNLSDQVDRNDAKSLFDQKQRGGKITLKDATENARKLGLAPSSSDEDKIREKYGETLDFEQFLEYLTMCLHENDNVDSLARTFEAFDAKGEGRLSKKQMKNILTTWGDPLSDAEATEILNSFSADDVIDYRKFCEYILE